MSNIENCLELLEKVEKRTFGTKPRTQLSIEDINDLTGYYQKLNATDRELVYDCVNDKVGLVIIGFTGDFAALAIDTKNVGWLKQAITLHIIEGFRFDDRENIRELIFIYNAANELGVNFRHLCEEMYPIASTIVRRKINSFCKRDPELNQLACFGMKRAKVNSKTKFIPN